MRMSIARQANEERAQDRQRVLGRVGVLELDDLLRHLDRGPVPLEPLLRDVALGRDPLGLAGLLEQRSALDQRLIRLCSPRPGRATGGLDRARAGRAPPRPVRPRRRSWATEASATLSRPGFFSPFVLSSNRGLLELLSGATGPAIGPGDRRLQPVPEGTLVAREIVDLVVADRRGRPEERLAGDAR